MPVRLEEASHELEIQERIKSLIVQGEFEMTDAYETVDIKIWAMRSLLTFPDSHFQSSLAAHTAIVASMEADAPASVRH
ncbi:MULTISPECIES: hypothetical protein [Cupriavidus]|uniref:Uncharacterized protein n=2 Tax=Cupriavidus TaxID=106589 RepID=A0A375HTX1_9BURK|nr:MULTISPECIES: hypothetical protein [Cupriavidus]MEC3767435.1 hypothetical protein [Cupriavidus sp. SS-3]SOZ39786.1 hypothetical protein CBM2605_B40117 [Cupriavidus neocaledonicus]SPD60883.1 protein of unknown function [Cupriavidus neocaledonicus]SPD66729.1 protein of unknown function [Cupriavidus taiwanensis]